MSTAWYDAKFWGIFRPIAMVNSLSLFKLVTVNDCVFKNQRSTKLLGQLNPWLVTQGHLNEATEATNYEKARES